MLAGLAAFVGSIGAAPTASPELASQSQDLGSIVPSETAAASTAPPASVAPRPVDSGASTVTLVGAGDIASCGLDDDSATAALIDAIPGTVFTAGDNAYPNGTAAEFADCYDPIWGRFKDRTRPAAGNHDWITTDAAGYLGYFGGAATNADAQTWYSYELGAWHVIVLDSDCAKVAGCDAGSDQGQWLAADLAAIDSRCTLAIWHHPRFSSGVHGSDPITAPFWDVLVAAGADVVVNGHDHDYERFAPQDASARPNPDGIREFVVGTGGAALRAFPGAIAANSLVRSSIAHGVIELTLQPSSYVWRFHSTDDSFSDQGSAACH